MKKFLLLGLIVCSFYACKSKDSKKDTVDMKDTIAADSTLITDSSWGLINSKTDFESLKQQYGASNVKNETICGPECADSIDVTIVYATTPKEMIVYWKDGGYHKTVEVVESAMRLDFAQHPAPDSLYGNRELNTDMPIVKSNMDKIVITDLRLSLNRN